METRTIKIPVYRDSEGNPVCFDGNSIKNKCIFLHEWLPYCDFYNEPVNVNNANKTLTPHKKYPLWRGELE